ncbi:hypothetical protein HOLleu_21865 [Holothuria leucospilota]|uniref:SnoaL-like domain-containing protein n=1 Tax=Holothuria leucospilota TaxID=206669 RepID=A0A9Q1BY91_HOLLE|nr:hypothetical protein HOLleu_21865 [Holothuria leucospilota]
MRAFQLILLIISPWCILGDSPWRDDGRCGASFLLANGDPAQCDPASDNYCCSCYGRCGSGPDYCGCTSCINYRATFGEAQQQKLKAVYKLPGVNQEVTSLFQNFGRLYAAKDFDRLSQLYTDDLVIMPPGSQILRGKESVKTIANKLWEDGIRGVDFRNEEAADIGGRDMAYSIGHLTRYFGNGTIAHEGKSTSQYCPNSEVFACELDGFPLVLIARSIAV